MSQFDLGPRLGDDPLDVLRHVLSMIQPPHCLALEFGVASGRSLQLIAEKHPTWGFDSFEGLPEDWRPGFSAGTFACPIPDIEGRAMLVVGRFEETLPRWTAIMPTAPVDLIHIDCDLYSSTVTILNSHLASVLDHEKRASFSDGRPTYVVFDEFHGYPGHEDHEMRAWDEFVERTDIEYDVIGHGPEQWAVRVR